MVYIYLVTMIQKCPFDLIVKITCENFPICLSRLQNHDREN